MKTFLERINDFTAEYITTPLQHFFLLFTIGLFSLLLIVVFLAPMSWWKLFSVLDLYILSIITALLAYGNYQLDALSKHTHNEWDEEKGFKSEDKYFDKHDNEHSAFNPNSNKLEANTGFIA